MTKSTQTSIPKPLSKGEETLAFHLRLRGIEFEKEVCFVPDRKWRFDFVLPGKIAVEIDGFTLFGDGKHSKGKGYENDCRKVNAAAALGYRVMRYTTAMVMSGEAEREIAKLLGKAER